MTEDHNLRIRLAKLALIIEDLATGRRLAVAAPTDFSSRTLARHVLIRAKDFIAHARELRRPLRESGVDTKSFHAQKEIYARYFDEYFQTARDKLSGHVQDLDFTKRIELWNDIESSKLDFFVDAAIEIHETLRKAIPWLLPLSGMHREDTALREQLQLKLFSGIPNSSAMTMATDPLAFTRPNTSGVLNFSESHQRASQLSLARLWIEDELVLLQQLDESRWVHEKNAVLSRLLTDTISFADCLVTYKDATGEAAIVGLSDIIRETETTTSLDLFVSSFRFEELRERFRKVRNKIGAHYELSPALTGEALTKMAQQLSVQDLTDFARHLVLAFARACQDVPPCQ